MTEGRYSKMEKGPRPAITASDGGARILALDVGTTSIRAHIYNSHAIILFEASRDIELLHPKPGWVEMDEEVLWAQTQAVITEAIKGAGITANEVTAMGITVQRNTFMLWGPGHRPSVPPLHHLDGSTRLRACQVVE